jgi:DNA-binding MarR family transcriptional regulator
VPSRSARRSTARRASSRRRSARGRQSDTASRIVAYLEKHPNSTAGDLAKGLNLKRNSVSTKLTQMAKAGQIKKAERGYTAK